MTRPMRDAMGSRRVALVLATWMLVGALPRTILWAAPPAAAEPEIRQALGKRVTLEFSETPLQEAVQYLQDQQRFSVLLDLRRLNEAGIAADAQLTFNSGSMRLDHALSRLLSPLELTWIIRDDALVILPESSLDNVPEVRFYEVADLVAEGPEEAVGAGELIGLIHDMVEPGSWNENGGPAVIRYRRGRLVVRNHFQAQERLTEFLAALRKPVSK